MRDWEAARAPPAEFRPYASHDLDACLALFDVNCPAAFAPNERVAYRRFLARGPKGYRVCYEGSGIRAAGGLDLESGRDRGRITWIMVHPLARGCGLGAQMMGWMVRDARAARLRCIDIAASQVSAPFFAHFGARVVGRIAHGWGSDMHRVDMQLSLDHA